MQFLVQKGAKQKFSIKWYKDRIRAKNERKMIDCLHVTVRIYVWTIHIYIWEVMISIGGQW